VTLLSTPACVIHTPGWLDAIEADDLFATLTTSIPWEQKTIRMYGREVATPRLTAWFGGASYSYSGTENAPHAWLPELEALRARLEIAADAQFNSCLANVYRCGADSVSWHSDDEPELGAQPVIASISLGDTRDFRLRDEASRAVSTVPLGHGDLLVMRGESQSHFRHSVPKRAHAGTRINLTFRYYAAAPRS